MKKVILIVSLLIVLMLFSVGLWVYFAFLYTKPLSRAELAQLTPDWSVVTHGNWSPWFTKADGTTEWNPAASFNAWVATVPEEDKAWPMLVDLKYANLDLFDTKNICELPDARSSWEEVMDVLDVKKNAQVMSLLKDALQRPVLGCGLYVSNDPVEHETRVRYGLEDQDWDSSLQAQNQSLLDTQFPAIRTLHTMIKVFGLYAGYQLELGDVDEFIELMTVLMESSRFSDEFPFLINQLFSLGIESLATEHISWALDRYPGMFDDSHLVLLDQLVARHQHRTFLWQGEAIGFHDSIRRVVDDKGSLKMAGARTLQGGGGSFNTPTNLPDIELHASTQRTLYAYNKMLAQAQVESSSSLMINGMSATQILESEKRKLNNLGSLLLDMLPPVVDQASERFRQLQQSSVNLRLTIAAHRHALRHGQMHESNETIDEDLLPD